MSISFENTPPIVGESEGDEKIESSSKMKEKDAEKIEVKTDNSNSDCDDKPVKVKSKGSAKTFTKIPFNYDQLSGSSKSSYVNLGKPPHLDGMGYTS